ncbi:MFS transporter [Micromonospora aurantiaca (nom. illeg.)]|uniref:hypothetical protein n=1 Tax=Micromonospora aurantiaca (nom. illeg.) TaxID=47850 RepID=UPI00379722ED
MYTPAAVTFFLCSLLAGRLVPVWGCRVLEVGAVLLAAGYTATVIAFTSGPRLTPALVIPTPMLQSVGGGLLITPMLNTVLSRIDPADAGVASGVLATAQQVGGALGVAGVGLVFFRAYHPTDGNPAAAAAHALAMASACTLVLALVAAVLVRLLPAGPRNPPGGQRR